MTCRNRMTIAQEEVFGPVGVTIGFDSDEEAIAIANDSRYGLNGGILSADAATAYEMSLKIRAGSVYINGGTGKMSYAPIGGYKRSGIGREYGPGLAEGVHRGEVHLLPGRTLTAMSTRIDDYVPNRTRNSPPNMRGGPGIALNMPRVVPDATGVA